MTSLPSDNQIRLIAHLAEAQLAVEQDIAATEEKLKELKKRHAELSRQELPQAMEEAGVSTFTLSSGAQVEVRSGWAASIRAEDQPAAFQWLIDHSHDSILKEFLTCQFGMGEREDAVRAAQALLSAGFHPERKNTVHPATLKRWVREMMEAGEEVPTLFNPYEYSEARIKL